VQSLTKAQKGFVEQVANITGCTAKQATDVLKSHAWNVEEAVEYWFDNVPAAPAAAASSAKYVAPSNNDKIMWLGYYT
jgi:hypothetical protein